MTRRRGDRGIDSSTTSTHYCSHYSAFVLKHHFALCNSSFKLQSFFLMQVYSVYINLSAFDVKASHWHPIDCKDRTVLHTLSGCHCRQLSKGFQPSEAVCLITGCFSFVDQRRLTDPGNRTGRQACGYIDTRVPRSRSLLKNEQSPHLYSEFCGQMD